MKKRLKKKLSTNAKYELSELEELMILAHRINQTKTGCVFIRDAAHISEVEIEVRFSKVNYSSTINQFSRYYDKNKSNWNSGEPKEFKEQLVNLLEELTTKKD